MRNLLDSFQQSAKDLRRVPTLAIAGVLIAMAVILASVIIYLSTTLRVSFSFLPLAVGGMLFGPVVGGVMGAAIDILGYFVHPSGAYFPGFTISTLLTGVLYGCFLYKKTVTWKRVLLASAVVTVLVNLLLNPFWLSILYHQPFIVLFSAHIMTGAILFPINTVAMYALLKVIGRIRVRSSKTV